MRQLSLLQISRLRAGNQDLCWDLDLELPAGCYRLELSSADPITWHVAQGMLSTCHAQVALDEQRMKRA